MGEQAPLTVLQSVRCLECGAVYAKPERGGTLIANPGCPECSYVGWLPLTVPVTHELVRPRFVWDRQWHPPAV